MRTASFFPVVPWITPMRQRGILIPPTHRCKHYASDNRRYGRTKLGCCNLLIALWLCAIRRGAASEDGPINLDATAFAFVTRGASRRPWAASADPLKISRACGRTVFLIYLRIFYDPNTGRGGHDADPGFGVATGRPYDRANDAWKTRRT